MQIYFLIGIALIAVIMDIKKLKIDNRIILAGITLGICFGIMYCGMEGLVLSLSGVITPVICLWVLYKHNVFGAGDIKLFSVIGSFIGPVKIMYCIATSILIAGIIGVVILVIKHKEKGLHKIRFSIPVLISVLIYGGGLY